jgi:hypothetical protein
MQPTLVAALALLEGLMQGRITRVSITYATDTDDGPQHRFIGLTGLVKHIRPDRLKEFLDEAQVICEEIQAARDAAGGRASSARGAVFRCRNCRRLCLTAAPVAVSFSHGYR